MDYRNFSSECISQVEEIYKENGWTAYLGDKEKLKISFDRSLYILGVFDGDKLIGFIRCLGDGIHLVYIQDLILRPSYQRQGIGSTLSIRQ